MNNVGDVLINGQVVLANHPINLERDHGSFFVSMEMFKAGDHRKIEIIFRDGQHAEVMIVGVQFLVTISRYIVKFKAKNRFGQLPNAPISNTV